MLRTFKRWLGIRAAADNARADDRDWRKLVPQDVHRLPTGVTGRRRAARSWVSSVLVLTSLAALVSLLWFALEDMPLGGSPANKSLKVRTDGFLNAADLRPVVFPATQPEGLDVAALRVVLESDRQVLSARVRRLADGVLDIELRERLAVARLDVTTPGVTGWQLLGADGVPFSGRGYPAAAVRNLPVIRDLPEASEGGKQRSAGLELVATFLTAAKASYPNLHAEWQAISLRDAFDGRPEIPGAVMRVQLRPSSQPADRPALTEVVFSAAEWARELPVLAGLGVDERLRAAGMNAPAYVLKLHIRNRSQPGTVTMEPRLVPAVTR